MNILDKKCALCLVEEADKKNSHIIPKFLGKSLFHKLPYKHTIAITSDLKSRKMQDIPKEDHLLCSYCERRLSVIETIFARYIDQIHSYKANKAVIDHIVPQNYLVCNQIYPTLFKLFFYSVIWRLSVTSLREFGTFKFESTVEEELRIFIHRNLKTTKGDLLSGLEQIDGIPNYDLCLVKPENRLYPPRSFMSAHSFNSNLHLIMFSELSLFFAISDEALTPLMKFYSNRQNKRVIIGLGKERSWDYFNDMLLTQFRNQNN